MPKPRTKLSPARGGPMQMTASSGYAIHGLGYLAWKSPDQATFLSEIAEHFAIPASYLAKVFQALARTGLVKSYRGAKGGYALARPADEITLRSVIEVFEGPIHTECSLERGPCENQPVCQVYARLAKAQLAFLKELEEHTIGHIGREFARFYDLESKAGGKHGG